MKFKNLLSLVLSAALLPVSVQVNAEEAIGLIAAGRTATPISDAVSQTPEENMFDYDGQKFILLDKEEKDGKMYFFVISENVYGKYKFDSSSRSNDDCLAYWEPDDKDNIAYWLNHDFWENGNEGMALPEKLKEYIDGSHVWHTEPMRRLENYQTERMTAHPLALLANYEWKKYITKIGQNVTSGWYFRTARTGDVEVSNSPLCTGADFPLGTTGAWRANGSPLGIRPVFYLDSDFFFSEKVDNMGYNVIKEIDPYCNPDLYTDEEKQEYFPAPNAAAPTIDGEVVVGRTLTLNYQYEGVFEEADTEFEWYQSADKEGGYLQIEGENGRELVIDESLQGKYIKAAVIPKSISVVNPVGEKVMTEVPVGYIYGEKQINDAINAVLSASADEVFAELEKANVVFNLDLETLSYDSETCAAAMQIFSEMEFNSIDTLRTAFKKSVALAVLNGVEDIAVIETAIKSDDLGLDLERFNVLTDKSRVYDAVYKKNFVTYDDFERTFYQAVALDDVGQSDRNNIKSVLLVYNKWFSEDLSKLTDYQLGIAGIAILKGSYKDFASLDKAVAAACRDAAEEKENNDPKPPSSSSSSGGGGGGRNNSVITYHDTDIPMLSGQEQEEEKNEENDDKKVEFSDMHDAQWAEESVYALAKKGIVSGDGDGSFRPNAELTREEFVKMAVSAFYPDEIKEGVTEFEDVDSDKWYAPYVVSACRNNLVKGVSETKFGVGEGITREDMTVILYRAISKKNDVSSLVFDDEQSISEYALEAVRYMSGAGIISGMDNNRFEPKQKATRAMAAQILYKTLQYAEK